MRMCITTSTITNYDKSTPFQATKNSDNIIHGVSLSKLHLKCASFCTPGVRDAVVVDATN